MKTSPTMQQFVQQLAQRHSIDLCPVGMFLRLDLPEQNSLVIDHLAATQMAVTQGFAESDEWQIEREVIFFIGNTEWIPLEITQLATGWMAYAKLDATGQRIVRINHCGQEKLALFTEHWAVKLLQQNWLEQGKPYPCWLPPARKEST